jgi:AP-1-like factor
LAYLQDADPITVLQDVDINELCAEFTNKAKCDGTKVVLDPQGVNQIIDKFTRTH